MQSSWRSPLTTGSFIIILHLRKSTINRTQCMCQTKYKTFHASMSILSRSVCRFVIMLPQEKKASRDFLFLSHLKMKFKNDICLKNHRCLDVTQFVNGYASVFCLFSTFFSHVSYVAASYHTLDTIQRMHI